jgi:hypothetical protein
MAQTKAKGDVETAAEADDTFGLDEVIAALSRDLKKAQEEAAKAGPFGLYLGEAKVELQFTVQRSSSKEGGGGVNFRVFGVGLGLDGKATAGSSNESVQRIELTLVPGPVAEDDGPAPGPIDVGKKTQGRRRPVGR